MNYRTIESAFSFLVTAVAFGAVACGSSRNAPGSSPADASLPDCKETNVRPARTGLMSFSTEGGVIYAVGEWVEDAKLRRALVRSTDDGVSFCALTAPPIADIVVGAGRGALWGRTEGAPAGVVYSDDFGATWNAAWDSSLGEPGAIVPPVGGSSDVLWIALRSGDAFAVTRDRGHSWSRVAPAAPGSNTSVFPAGDDPTRPGNALFAGYDPTQGFLLIPHRRLRRDL